MPNFSSVALFVQKISRWSNSTPPQLLNVHKKGQLGKSQLHQKEPFSRVTFLL